ncbi:MAG TPA: GAF domain-containing protein [Armatimonadota bacterium]|jgi:two-component sensor histidine kinase
MTHIPSKLDEAREEIRKLQDELCEKDIEVDALRKLGQAIGSSFETVHLLETVADIAVQVTRTDTCWIYLLDETGRELVLRAAKGPTKGVVGKIRLQVSEGISGWVVRQKKNVALAREAFRDHRFKAFSEIEEDRFQSMLSVPLVAGDEALGVINIKTDNPHEYTNSQIRLMERIAEQVANAIQSSRLYRKMEAKVSQLTTLSEMSRSITSGMYLDEILQLIVAMTAESMKFKIVTVMLLDEEKQELSLRATQSTSREYIAKPNLKLHESLAGRAISEGHPIAVLDVRKTPEYRYPDIARKEGLCSMISVPLVLRDKVIGVMNCYTERPHVFGNEEISVLMAIGSHAAIALENAKLVVRSAIVQEMHHRVKNNLQTIASLLRLQMQYSKLKSVEDVLQESINRILSIAAVHEVLSKEEMERVSIRRVAENILKETHMALAHPTKQITTSLEGPEILLPPSKATSLALVLNELIQNAMEHGFEKIDRGEIKVELIEEDREIRLIVTNDGTPLPQGFDVRKHRNLGLQIVDSLVHDDLHGNFTLESNGKIVATVVFPK